MGIPLRASGGRRLAVVWTSLLGLGIVLAAFPSPSRAGLASTSDGLALPLRGGLLLDFVPCGLGERASFEDLLDGLGWSGWPPFDHYDLPRSDFAGLIAGQIGSSRGDEAGEVTLDGTELTGSGTVGIRAYDEWEDPPSTSITMWYELAIGGHGPGRLTVRGGGHLRAYGVELGSQSRYDVIFPDNEDDPLQTIWVPPVGKGVLAVEGAGSTFTILSSLSFTHYAELSIRDGGTLQCEDVDAQHAAGQMVVEGDGSLWDVETTLVFGQRSSPGDKQTTLCVRDGGRLAVASELTLERNAALDLTDGGYARVGHPVAPAPESGTLCVGPGGRLRGGGRIDGRVVVESGGTIGQWEIWVAEPDDQCSLEMTSLNLHPGGRVLLLAHEYLAGTPAVRVYDHAELHGTIDVRFDGDYLPDLAQAVPLVEWLGTADTTGLEIRAAPWLKCTPSITSDGIAAVFDLAGDGAAGSAAVEGTYLAGIMGYAPNEIATADLGPERLTWSAGTHLVTEPHDEPGLLFVGYGGAALLTVAGRTVENRRAVLGALPDSQGTVILDGPNTCWRLIEEDPETDTALWHEYSSLRVGGQGHGQLIVRNGASLVMPYGRLVLGTGIEPDQDSQGLVIAQGPGSRAEVKEIFAYGTGKGALSIVNGAEMKCGGFEARSYGEPQDITVLVDGPGSLLKCEHDFRVCSSGTLSATVSGGGRVECDEADVECWSSPTPVGFPVAITIDGAESTWNARSFELGGHTRVTAQNGGAVAVDTEVICHGTVDLRDGGLFRVGGTSAAEGAGGVLVVGSGGVLTGEGAIQGHVVVEQDAQLHKERSYSHDGAYTLTVDSLETLAGSDTWINLLDDEDVVDGLVVLGDARLAGTVHVAPSWEWDEAVDWEPGASRDVVSVGGTCDWSDVELSSACDPRIRILLHDHGMTVTVTGWAGDANQDGRVNDRDASILAANWLSKNATWSMGDFTLDGVVNGQDAAVMARYWLTDWRESPPVPEPSSLALLVGLLPLMLKRRRQTTRY